MNPVDFEYNPRYLAYLASHIYSNKYYEYVQGDDPTQTTVAHYKLLSIFNSVADMEPYTNKVYRVFEEGRQMLYRFQDQRKYLKLQYVQRQLEFFHEHFCRFLPYNSYPDKTLSKETMIVAKRVKNEEMIEEILDNLRKVNDLRKAKNELVFTSAFIMEHRKLVTLVKTISGMTDEEIETRTNGKGLTDT